MALPEIQRIQAAMLLEAFRSGYWGEVQEMVIATWPWGLRMDKISLPIQLCDGDQNNLIPPSHAEYPARAIPNARPHIRSGGAYMIVDHMEEILQGITTN